MYNTKLALEYLKTIQTAYDIGDISAMKSSAFVPEEYRKMYPHIAENIEIVNTVRIRKTGKARTIGLA